MNTHLIKYKRVLYCIYSISICAFITVLPLTDAQNLFADSSEIPSETILRRVILQGKEIYYFDFDLANKEKYPEFKIVTNTSVGNKVNTLEHLLHSNILSKLDYAPMRWDKSSNMLFCTLKRQSIQLGKFDVSVLRFPIDAVVPSPNGRLALNRDILNRHKSKRGLPSPNFVGLAPLSAHHGGIGYDDQGDPILLKVIPEKHFYDIRVSNDDTIILFMTLDGKLSRWMYEDGKDWEFIRKYDFKVEGPFLVTDSGNSIVSQREGKWCVISGIETDEPTIEPIAPVQKNIPLILIEDMTAKKQYFDLDGRVFDMKGMEIEHFPDLKNFNDRAELLFDFIIKQRE